MRGSDPSIDSRINRDGASRLAGELDENSSTEVAIAGSNRPWRADRDSARGQRRQAICESTIRVRGRCVAAETQRPLARCLVVLTSQRDAALELDARAQAFASAHTDHEGRFAIEVAVHRGQALVLTVRLPGRADVRGVLGQLSEDIHAGDIEIPLGTRLQGRVVNEDGAPVPGVRLRLFHGVSRTWSRFSPVGVVVADSDEHGKLSPAQHLLPGAWHVDSNGLFELLKPAGPVQVEARLRLNVQQETFVVRLPDPKSLITGRILDLEGRGLAEVPIQAVGDSKWPLGQGCTDERGRFQVRCLMPTDEPVRFVVPAVQGFEGLMTRQAYAWGSSMVVLTLRRAGGIQLAVVEAGTGRPVEGYVVAWRGLPPVSFATGTGARSEVEHHLAGRATIKAVPSGRIGIVVTPDDKDLAANDPVEISKGAGWSAVRIELARKATLPVLVVHRDGRPVAASRLELLRARDGKRITPGASGLAHSDYLQWIGQEGTPLLLDETRTDAEGRAKLRWRTSSRSLVIRASGQGHLPIIRERVFVGSDNRPVQIVVDTGARISGQVGPLSVLREIGLGKGATVSSGQAPTLAFKYAGEGGPRGAERHKKAQLDGHGRFSLGKLHPGTWSVTFHSWHFSPGSGVRVGSKELPRLTLRGGETRRVAYDVADLKPATVRGLVSLDGSPAANSRVRLNRPHRMHTTGRARSGTTLLSTDRDGAFLATSLYPGRYRLDLWCKRSGARHGTWLPCPTIVVVPPGSRTSQTFQLQAGALHIKVITKRGEPAAHVLLDVHDPGSGLSTSGRTDAHGCLVLDPIAVGLYVVRLSLPSSSAPSRSPRVPSAAKPETLIRLGQARVLSGPKPSLVEYSIPRK